MGNPPALPGDSQSLTVTGVATDLRCVHRSAAHGKKTGHERLPEATLYEGGRQIAGGVASEAGSRGQARRAGAPEQTALSGSQAKASGFAGGYLLNKLTHESHGGVAQP